MKVTFSVTLNFKQLIVNLTRAEYLVWLTWMVAW